MRYQPNRCHGWTTYGGSEIIGGAPDYGEQLSSPSAYRIWLADELDVAYMKAVWVDIGELFD